MAARKVTPRLFPVIVEGQIDGKTFKEIAAELGVHESKGGNDSKASLWEHLFEQRLNSRDHRPLPSLNLAIAPCSASSAEA